VKLRVSVIEMTSSNISDKVFIGRRFYVLLMRLIYTLILRYFRYLSVMALLYVACEIHVLNLISLLECLKSPHVVLFSIVREEEVWWLLRVTEVKVRRLQRIRWNCRLKITMTLRMVSVLISLFRNLLFGMVSKSKVCSLEFYGISVSLFMSHKLASLLELGCWISETEVSHINFI
jgi:hypothetical protein